MSLPSHPAFHVIIPARWHSSRLPGKMLADIDGLPMVIRVARQAQRSGAISVTIAADDQRILNAAESHDIAAIATMATHPSGTDRLAEAVDILGLSQDSLIVNVQGDEPLIDPRIIDQVAQALSADREASIATCASVISDAASLANPNVVKVVCDNAQRALYFSRSPIPHVRDASQRARHLHHIGIYAYRSGFLKSFPQLTPGLLEQSEMLEQLRALEHGFKIHVCITEISSQGGVDTQQDLDRVRHLFEERRAGQT